MRVEHDGLSLMTEKVKRTNRARERRKWSSLLLDPNLLSEKNLPSSSKRLSESSPSQIKRETRKVTGKGGNV